MRTGPRTGFRWNCETIVYAIRLWHRKHARPPLTREWERAGENHPARMTVARAFGSWNAGIAAAGLAPRPRGRPSRLSTGFDVRSETELTLDTAR
jgi:hypothetical protein